MTDEQADATVEPTPERAPMPTGDDFIERFSVIPIVDRFYGGNITDEE